MHIPSYRGCGSGDQNVRCVCGELVCYWFKGGPMSQHRSVALVKTGHPGRPVKTLQYLLRARGRGVAVDGVFGPTTDSCKNLPEQQVPRRRWGRQSFVVGGSGDHGATAAMPGGLFRKNSNFAINLATPSRSTGGWVLQTPDGQRGSRFQNALSLDILSVAADGIVGPITWRALVSGMLAG